jgi:hydrophobic/amphiphilic exporter-1 (mainly G- bacteria), HAE1 family
MHRAGSPLPPTTVPVPPPVLRYFARHPTAANLVMGAIVILGLLAFLRMNRAVFPDFDLPVIQIVTVYPGASAEEVEEAVVRRIERQLESLQGVKRIESLSRDGTGVVTILLKETADPDAVRVDVETELDLIVNLPELAENPVVKELELIPGVMHVAVAGNVPEKHLLAFAERLKDGLLTLGDVNTVRIKGLPEHELRIEVFEEALLSHGLSIADVANEIRTRSLDLPAGVVETGEREISVRVVDQRRWAEEFRDLSIVSAKTGASVPLRALAEVTDGFEDDWNRATFNGKPAVHLEITTTKEEDVIRVAQQVTDYLASHRDEYPDEIEIEEWLDLSFLVRDRLEMLYTNLAQGVVLVFLTLWLFLNVRLAFWVAMGLPVSLLGGIFVMYYSGMTLDMFTMLALIMAIGIIVDDAIVIAENVYARASAGEDDFEAAVAGTRQVALGVLASMLTTIAVFMPLLVLQGVYGKIFRVLPYCLIMSLIVSLIEAFLVLPNHLAHAMPRPGRTPRLRQRIDRVIDGIRENVYGRVLDWSLAHRSVAFALAIALFVASIGLLVGKRLKWDPMPAPEGNHIVATVKLPEGADPRRTREAVAKVQQAIVELNADYREREGGEELVEEMTALYGAQFLEAARGTHVGEVMIEMRNAEFRETRQSEVVDEWQRRIGNLPDAVRVVVQNPDRAPGGRAIEIALSGADLEHLDAAAAKLAAILASYPGVRNVEDDLKIGRMEARIRLKDSAAALGVTASSVAQQLRGGLFGDEAEEFQRGGDVFDVRVSLHARNRRTADDVEFFAIRTPDGLHVPLIEVADVDFERGYASVPHEHGKRTVTVGADVDGEITSAAYVLEDVEAKHFGPLRDAYPGLGFRFAGAAEDTQETIDSMGQGLVIGLLLVYVVLAFVFRSYVEPFVVMLAIPLGLIGAIAGHWILGMTFSIASMIGFVSLAGILVNDSIVMVEFIKFRLAEGLDPKIAIPLAGRQRFRAVVLTTATTIAGLLPLMLEQSIQAKVLQPLVVSVIFGELFSTSLILVLLPCAYGVLADLGLVSVATPPAGETPHESSPVTM